MSAKNFPILLILFLLVSCQPDPAPSVSNGGVATAPDISFDTVPVSEDLSLPPIFEDNESNWIALSYTDAEDDKAISCQIFNRSYLNVTSACTCFIGSCFLKVKPFENYSGVVSFQYSVTANNLTSDPATASFVVVGVSDAPSAIESSFYLYENTTYTSDGTISYPDLSGTDPDSDPLTCIKVTDPINGALTLNADCSFSYTPVASFVGTDSFTFKVNDGVNDSAVATVSIDVLL